jgi:hypothetical protein
MKKFLFVIWWCLASAPLLAQDKPLPAELLVKAGVSRTDAVVIDTELRTIQQYTAKVKDSTATYEELQIVRKSYQTIYDLLLEKKIKPATLFVAYPDSKETIAHGRTAKGRAEYLEANDTGIKFRKSANQLDEELRKANFGKANTPTDAMLTAFGKRLAVLLKNRPQNESFLLDSQIIVGQLAAVSLALRTKTDYVIDQQFGAAIKRLRRTDLHHDEEFAQHVGYKEIFERLIAAGEVFAGLQ